jgi:hypothetical protein
MIAMVIPGDIGSLIDFFSFTALPFAADYLYHQELPWQCCNDKEIYQTTYITRNYHGNAVKLKKSISLPKSHYHGNPVKLKNSIRLPISPGITMAML